MTTEDQYVSKNRNLNRARVCMLGNSISFIGERKRAKYETDRKHEFANFPHIVREWLILALSSSFSHSSQANRLKPADFLMVSPFFFAISCVLSSHLSQTWTILRFKRISMVWKPLPRRNTLPGFKIFSILSLLLKIPLQPVILLKLILFRFMINHTWLLVSGVFIPFWKVFFWSPALSKLKTKCRCWVSFSRTGKKKSRPSNPRCAYAINFVYLVQFAKSPQQSSSFSHKSWSNVLTPGFFERDGGQISQRCT